MAIMYVTLTCILGNGKVAERGTEMGWWIVFFTFESGASLPCALFGQRILVLIEQQIILNPSTWCDGVLCESPGVFRG